MASSRKSRLCSATFCKALLATLSIRLCIEIHSWSTSLCPSDGRGLLHNGAAFAAPTRIGTATATPTSEDLMQSLGRELWAASDEMLSMCAMLPGGQPVSILAISLRNCADVICDGPWEEVMADLETTAYAADTVVSPERFQGLVNLFAYDQPVPAVEWNNARESLWYIAQEIENYCDSRCVNEDQENSLEFVLATLRKAMKLFEPGNFYVAENPRTGAARVGVGQKRKWKGAIPYPDQPGGFDYGPAADYYGGGSSGRSSGGYVNEKQARRQKLKDKALKAAGPALEAAVGVRIASVDEQFLSAVESERSKLLRKLLKELHPDVNQGREAEVSPVFQYVQDLRSET